MARDLPDDRQPVTLQEAQGRLTALRTEMSERGYSDFWVDLKIDGVFRSTGTMLRVLGDNIEVRSDDPSDALAMLEVAVRALPDPGEQKRREAIKALLNAVDGCRDAGLDADFVNPLADAARKLAERALPAA